MRKPKRQFLLQLGLLVFLALTQCSKKEGPSLSITFPPMDGEKTPVWRFLFGSYETRTGQNIPSTISQFDCLFVNVMGEGIKEWKTHKNSVVNRPNGYFGNSSAMIVPADGGTVSVTVPAGSSRIVQVLGVISNVGCPSSPSIESLNSKEDFLAIYEIGRQTLDIYKDTSVTITSDYDPASARDTRYDNLGSNPTIVSVTPTSGSLNEIPSTVSVEFSEVVANPSASNFVLSGNCAPNPTLTTSTSGKTVTATLSGGNCYGKDLTVTVNPSNFKSLSGLTGTGAQVSRTFSIINPATPATLDISGGVSSDFDTTTVGNSTDKEFTVTNNGGTAASSMAAVAGALQAPFTYKSGSYPGASGEGYCGTTLAAGASCKIVLTYTPVASGTHNDTIEISYNDGLSSQTVSLNISGKTPAVITITDDGTSDYGVVGLNTSSDKTFTLTNSGGVSATGIEEGTPALSAPYSFPGGFPGTGGTCEEVLTGSNSTCTIVVRFSPTVSGVQSGTIKISYNDSLASQTATRAVTGTGQELAVLSISDGSTYDFSGVNSGSSADKTFTVTNTATVPATIMAAGTPALSSPYSFKGGTYPGNGGDCSTSLDASSTCTVVVTFAPSSTGTFTDTLRIAYHNGASDTSATRALTGMGVSSGGGDTSFNGSGTATVSVGSTNLNVYAMAFQSDGKIVVAGSWASGSTSDFMVARYNINGTLDNTFGTSGITHSAIGSGTNDDAAYGIAIDNSQQIYVVGRTKVANSVYNWAIARYTSTGSLDTNFSSDGIVTTTTAALGGDSDTTSEAKAIVIDPNGKIVVVGFAVGTIENKVRNNFAVARYTTAGALDTSSAGGNTPFNSTAGAQIVKIGTNTATGTDGDIALGVVIDTVDSTIVLGGQADVGSGNSHKLNFGIARVAANGGGTPTTASAAFNNGNATDVATCMAIDSNNRVVMGGYTGSPKQFGVMRFQSGSTSLDTANFNIAGANSSSAGTFKFSVGSTEDIPYRLLADSSNRILLAGKSSNGTHFDFALARVTAAGGLDTTFNSTGKKTVTITASADNIAYEILVDSLGRILLGGITTISGFNSMALTRFWP